MKNSQPLLTCAQVRKIDLVDYLKSQGHEPTKIRGNDYWYLSLLRLEKKASLKVNSKMNSWYDHDLGKSGNLIDFTICYHDCTIAELLQQISGNFSFHRQHDHLPVAEETITDEGIKIIDSRPLHSLSLLTYLHSRNIPISIADQYCREINFVMQGKFFYSIGFLNDSGGCELRNKFYKSNSRPKAITSVKNGAKKVAVFEGFFDFPSFLILSKSQSSIEWDFCILNSLSFFEKSVPFLSGYASVHFFLDNDAAGQNCSKLAIRLDTKFMHESGMYKNYKDLNEWIVLMGKQTASANKHSFYDK